MTQREFCDTEYLINRNFTYPKMGGGKSGEEEQMGNDSHTCFKEKAVGQIKRVGGEGIVKPKTFTALSEIDSLIGSD